MYLFKYTIRPCMEYCCHVWAGDPSCYLELLDELQKRICRTSGPSLAASLLVLQNWRNWFHFLFLEEGLLVILIDCMVFLSSFLDVTRCLCQQLLSSH